MLSYVNFFTGEVPSKFEIFPDRMEITSAGGLPEGLSQEEFFQGFSVPRNKELMRVFNRYLQAGVGLSKRLKCLKIRHRIGSTFDVFRHFVSKYWR